MASEPHIGVDKLKYLFMQTLESMTPASEAILRPLNETFWEACREIILHRKQLNIQILGEVRTGKSTVELLIWQVLNLYIEKLGLNKDIIKHAHKFIFCDQTEFLRFIDKEHRNVLVAIDEFNSMARTGLNATTEEALLEYHSNVFAGQYIHKVSSSPDVIIDKNATIILTTIGIDDEKGIVRCSLTYRDVTTKKRAIIGHVDFDVSKLIENWEKHIRQIVETRGIKTPQEEKLVEEWCEKDFYIAYQVKKYRRMQLLKKHGVRDIRELEYAQIILGCLEELEENAKIQVQRREMVNLVVDEVLNKHKRIYSILAQNEIVSKVMGILSIHTEISKIFKKRMGNSKTHPTETQKKIYENTMDKLKEMLKRRVEHQKKLANLYQEYVRIE